MREIKFRAWDDVQKEWLLGYEMPNLGGFSIVGETMMMGEWSCVLTDMLHGKFGERGEHLKVMQYTGLKDKNGKEIYEGDVVEYLERGMKNCVGIGQVTWNKDGWNVEGFYDGSQDEPGRAFSENAQLEIIGNVWENPELIEK